MSWLSFLPSAALKLFSYDNSTSTAHVGNIYNFPPPSWPWVAFIILTLAFARLVVRSTRELLYWRFGWKPQAAKAAPAIAPPPPQISYCQYLAPAPAHQLQAPAPFLQIEGSPTVLALPAPPQVQQAIPRRKLCRGITRKQEPCQRLAKRGSEFCAVPHP